MSISGRNDAGRAAVEVGATSAVDSRSSASEPSVVLFHRQTGRRPREQAALLLANLASIEADLRDGAIVVVEERRLRVRARPIIGSGEA